MTRTVEQIETDLAAVRRDHQEAVETHRVAKVVADDLRGRARAGDTSVTAAALAEAEHAAEFAELPIPAKHEAIKEREAEKLVADIERRADEVTATVTPLAARFEQALAISRGVDDEIVESWRALATFLWQTSTEVEGHGMANVSPRIRRTHRGIVIDGKELIPPAVLEPKERSHRRLMERLLAGRPKPMK
jgi:hypothetical protein